MADLKQQYVTLTDEHSTSQRHRIPVCIGNWIAENVMNTFSSFNGSSLVLINYLYHTYHLAIHPYAISDFVRILPLTFRNNQVKAN